jgi:carboxylesterase type B
MACVLILWPDSSVNIDAGPHGRLKGVTIAGPDGHIKCQRFLQIPYAYPPVGDRRWKAPQPLPDDVSWSDVQGDTFGSITAQPTYQIVT